MKPTFVIGTAALLAGTALLVGTLRAQDAADTRERMRELGRQHRTSEDLYGVLKQQANAVRRTFAAALAAMALIGTVGAHHSATMFEQTRTITVEGVVKEFQFTNPHSWLLVDVTGKDGRVTTWGFEAEGPSTRAPE